MRLESIKWMPRARVDKYEQEGVEFVQRKTGILAPSADVLEHFGVRPYESREVEGNLLTTAGLTRLTALLTANGGTQAMTNTSVRLGVGDGAGGAAVGDTNLGGTNKWFQIMDATYPSSAAGVVTYKATVGNSDGNFAWNEWGLDIGTPTVASSNTVGPCFFNHKTSAALGTKASGSWALTVTVTFQ